MENKIVRQTSMENEYKKTGISPTNIAILRSWVQSQPHLPQISDLDLILAYHCCGSLELSKIRLDAHFTSRTHFTNLFKDRVVDENIINALKKFVFHLPETTSYNNNPILFVSLIDFSVNSFLYTDFARSSIMLLDLMQYELGCLPDTVVVVDCTGISFGHLPKLHIPTFQECLSYMKDAVLGKICSFHFLNTPSFASTVVRILKPIIPDELMRLVTFHEIGSKTIEKIMPVEYLPIESGGRYKTLEEISNESIEKIIANKDFFVRENKMRVMEHLRQEKSNRIDTYGGIGGSFKMLDID